MLDAERLGDRSPGWPGRRYPEASLDKAWRQLAFGAHHDAITGTEADQVYLDLLTGWREAWERGAAARRRCRRRTWPGLADTAARRRAGGQRSPARGATGRRGVQHAGVAQVRPGQDLAGVRRAGRRRRRAAPTTPARAVGYLAEGVARHADGSLAAVTLTFRAADVPPIGYRTYIAAPLPAAAGAGS